MKMGRCRRNAEMVAAQTRSKNVPDSLNGAHSTNSAVATACVELRLMAGQYE